MDDLYTDSDYDGLLSIRFLMIARWAYSRRYCKIFYTNFKSVSSWFRNIKKECIQPCPEICHKEMFLVTLVNTIPNVFSRYI